MKILVLTVGTNPLPVYVCAKYYLDQKEYNRFVLLHSKKNDDVGQASTEEFAKAIKALLGDCDECIKPIALTDVSDGKTIESDLTDYLKTHLTTSTEITYNYTGGSKSMSVHIYNWFRKNYPCAKFSYLNARKDS